MMLLAERAGRELERRSNSMPRGMTVTSSARTVPQNPAYQSASLFTLVIRLSAVFADSGPREALIK